MRGDGGYILVAVLGTMLVLASLIASGALVAQSVLRSARADEGRAGLDGLARGALEVAAFELFSLHLPFAAVNGHPFRFAGGVTTATFADEAARIDVNAADPAVLMGALRSAGLDEAAASALLGRMMMSRADSGSAGDASVAPDALPPPGAARSAKPAHGGFRSVADFIAFAGVGHETAGALQALLTASNPDGKVDALTASRPVLMALPGMSAALADTVMAERRSGPSALDRVKGALGAQAVYVKFEPGPCYGVTVLARDAVGRSATRSGIIAASRSPGVPFYTLMWEGS